ncbi:MAG: hypothetical protein C4324_10025 [Blastocatellia bacterium]
MFRLNRNQIIANLAAICSLPFASYFTSNVEFPPASGFISAANVVLFAAPAIWALRWWLGPRGGSILFSTLAVYAILIEAAAIATGFPYGHFGYSHLLGFQLFGLVPWTVAFAWPPLILGAYSVAAFLFENRFLRILGTGVIATLFDSVLDPGAVSLGFWRYSESGFFYGVPASNFAGWLLTATAGAAIIEVIRLRLRPLLPAPLQLAISSAYIVYFWSLVDFWRGNLLPAGIGLMMTAAVSWLILNKRYSFDDRIVFADDIGRPIGTGDKYEAHNSETKLHLAFSIFIFDSLGCLLLQQRSRGKKTWPGVWSNSCCGHLRLHETAMSAARRRLRQELGIRNVRLFEIIPDFRYRAEKDGIVENEICPVFIGFYDGELKPARDEVEATEWRNWEEICSAVAANRSELSPWAQLEIKALVQSEEFHNFLNSRRFRPSKLETQPELQ